MQIREKIAPGFTWSLTMAERPPFLRGLVNGVALSVAFWLVAGYVLILVR